MVLKASDIIAILYCSMKNPTWRDRRGMDILARVYKHLTEEQK